ncbi:16S rRNA (cytidine(1402)-2'-O)-methyltransferase [Pseudokineococcus sp. 1T1Z-3]|uniref:16S rRNA (cytidine(1402)-2'-O)-methyltransferase n=1 Tax=Pseudokineococcus sp. 1T1Z-3 TaxID=3132745 RepID=UPI0030AA1FBF
MPHHEQLPSDVDGPPHVAAADDEDDLPPLAPVTPRAGGRLLLAATPIGDARDAPPRLAHVLATADLVAAEDTRRLRRLLRALDVEPRGRVVSCHEHNESARAEDVVAVVRAGGTAVLVSDAGMPSVSDPGYRLVQAMVAADLPVSAVPGPSAVLAALAVSGLPTDRFTFEGFLPRKDGERRTVLGELADERRTMVFFESPHRLGASLAVMAETFGGDRRAAVCRELTKTYEEVVRDDLDGLLAWSDRTLLGEITLVVAGARPRRPGAQELLDLVLARTQAGERLKDAARAVAAEHGATSRDLYAAAVAARKG